MVEILFKDSELIVCIKPAGIHSEDSLTPAPNQMPYLLREALGDLSAPIYTVHRLDLQVSGVMIYARTKRAAAALSKQIQEHLFVKEYRAIIEGHLDPAEDSGRFEDLLYHDKCKNKVFVVKKERKNVKKASLRYQVLAQTETSSLLHITLETGRTHQIRVQCASRKHPLVGDGRYGSQTKGVPIALQSYHIACKHPLSGKSISFFAPSLTHAPWDSFLENEQL